MPQGVPPVRCGMRLVRCKIRRFARTSEGFQSEKPPNPSCPGTGPPYSYIYIIACKA